MRILSSIALFIFFLFQATKAEVDLYNFILVSIGIILLIIILIYIILTSKQE
ncbi:MAG: hypothetical protein Lokiarch_33860 [Candidatus Lokiarchaeum sp. GC14_75]|nr:MAG: hypothetical protein Lokiarch_33860 [Candidatus Lokiarchaeum sp. GC14_75]